MHIQSSTHLEHSADAPAEMVLILLKGWASTMLCTVAVPYALSHNSRQPHCAMLGWFYTQTLLCGDSGAYNPD